MWKSILSSLSLTLTLTLASAAIAEESSAPINIYIDADYSIHTASAVSIERGLKVALAEAGGRIQGRAVEVISLDHRGNSARSKLNFDRAFSDPNGLLVMTGIHTPPLIKNRTYINENKMLTLVPWAAGGPITRYPSEDNWVFRLSIDDTKAGYRIAQYAVKQGGCKAPHMLLEQTPWGESNEKTMTSAINELSLEAAPVTWFSWGLSEASARIKLRDISDAGAECILFVGNAKDGAVFANAVAGIEEKHRRPIFSHWGITGGDFHKKIDAKVREQVRIKFIQTCFSFVSSPSTPVSDSAIERARELFPDIKAARDIEAPPGFIHAYDLGKLLVAAVDEIDFGADMSENRAALKSALENLETPVEGLVKTYEKPFGSFNVENDSAHEALGLDDFCMAYYGPDDEIIVMSND